MIDFTKLLKARDLGPRIFTSMVYGGEVFSAHSYYFWVPVVGPYVGGALAGLIYKFAVEVRFQNKDLSKVLKP